MKIKLATFIITLSVCFMSSGFAKNIEEPLDSLVLAMSSDDIEIFDGAITIGSVALARGHEVTMLLRLGSIKFALKDNQDKLNSSKISDRLSNFMKNGAKVIAGGKCIKQMGLKPSDLRSGVMIGTPDLVMGTLFKKDTKILSY